MGGIMKSLLTNILIMLLGVSLSFAQTGKEAIFGDVQKQIEEAREAHADILSPEFFREAEENFKTAEEYYTSNKSTRDIREKLTEASRFCTKAMDAVKVGKLTLKDAIRARYDALKVEADNYAPVLFKEASEIFNEAAMEVEDGDLDDARDRGSEAEQLFRKAELKSIKDKILNDARNSIAEAGEIDAGEHCPQTYEYAKGLLADVENLLRNNRYATEDANQKAIETAYQGRHAIHLTHEIVSLKENDKNWEKLILSFEDLVTSIGVKFDEKLRFDNGFKESVNTILTRITQMQEDNQRLITENETLQEELQLFKEKATTSTAELERKQNLEAKIDKIKAMFSLNEAKVIYDGDNLVIRLYGLNFQSGKSVILSEYFSLLRKVQEAIKEFPESHILLEGHTDSRGNPSTNKRLSEERAKAVREYIIANMEISREQITAIGYGDTKPVASNKTAEGRELNRRIDVVISLSN
jgi:outer membrane protein OmpA-like peptidoglycan-associated protein